MKERIRKLLLWLWPRVKRSYARFEIQVDLLDLREFRQTIETAAADIVTTTKTNHAPGAHGHTPAHHGPRVGGAHVWILALLLLPVLWPGVAHAQGGGQSSSTLPLTPTSITQNITTSAGSNVMIPFTGMGCVGIEITGAWTGSLAAQQTNNNGANWEPADMLQQLIGKWTESAGSDGRYYSGGYSAQYFRLNGPTSSGTATVTLLTSPNPCNEYTFAIPGTQAGNGMSALSATATQTSVPDGIQGEKEAELAVIWSGISGSPSGCQIQPQGSGDGANYMNSGPPLPVQPGTNALLTAPGPLGLAAQFVFTCGTYPTAGTITLKVIYKLGGQTLVGGSIPEVTAAWTSSTGANTALTQVVGGYSTANVFLNQGTTITSGVVTFEGSDTAAFTNAYPIACTAQDTFKTVTAYTLVASTNESFVCPVNAYTAFRVRLSTVISGTATVNVGISTSALPTEPQVSVGNSPSVFVAGTVAVSPNPVATSGAALTSANESGITASVNVKASAGNVFGGYALNGAASTCWIQFINSAGAGTLGTGVVFSIPLPASTTQPVTFGFGDMALSNFSTGIAVGIATTQTGSTACGTAGNVVVFYK